MLGQRVVSEAFLALKNGSMDCRKGRFTTASAHGLCFPQRDEGSRIRDPLGLKDATVQTSFSAGITKPADRVWRNRQLRNATGHDFSCSSKLEDNLSDPYQNEATGKKWQACPLPTGNSLQVLVIPPSLIVSLEESFQKDQALIAMYIEECYEIPGGSSLKRRKLYGSHRGISWSDMVLVA